MIGVFIMICNSFKADSNDPFERMLHAVVETYSSSFQDGRGIKRLACFLLGFVPFIALLLTICIGAMVYWATLWLVLPKERRVIEINGVEFYLDEEELSHIPS
jgi:hypothetical protein